MNKTEEEIEAALDGLYEDAHRECTINMKSVVAFLYYSGRGFAVSKENSEDPSASCFYGRSVNGRYINLERHINRL